MKYESKFTIMKAVEMLILSVMLLSTADIALMHPCSNDVEICRNRLELAFDFGNYLAQNCTNVPNCVCLHGMELVYYNYHPYIFYDDRTKQTIGILPEILNEALRLCCFGCNRIRYRPPIASLSEMFSAELMNNSYTAILPILATKSIKEYFAGPFISIISTPGVALVVDSANEEETFDHMMKAISGTWPLLVLSVLMSLNAGFVIWATDTRNNSEDFPRPFPRGALEGGWWAFVSMTTVGYGDKCPRSLISRVFAMMWIVFGIAVSGIFTASITSALTAAITDVKIDLGKKKVGVLNTTRYEYNIALREGATPVVFATIPKMKAALKANDVAGLLLDHNVLGYNWDYLKSGMSLYVKTGIVNSDTTYGIMFLSNHVSNESKQLNLKWATYLSTFFEYNKDNQNIMISMAKKKLDKKISHEPFKVVQVNSGFTKQVYMMLFKNVGITTGIMIGCGIIYEIIRRCIASRYGNSCCVSAAKVKDDGNITSNGSRPVEIEMEDLTEKAEKLIHNLEEILQEMKTVKRKTTKF